MPLANQRPAKEFRTRGPFDNTIDYVTDDRVSYNGRSYVAPEPIPAGEGVPNPGTNKWIDDPGSEGQAGGMGIKGDGVRAVYIRVAEGVTPVDPMGTWDGTTLTLMGGWSETEPLGTGVLWRADVELDSVANTATFTAKERWTGPVGPEPSNTRLNALLSNAISAMDLQDTAGVEAIISAYVSANQLQTLSNVQTLLNQAYLNVLRDLGAIQVQYSLDGIDYQDMLNTYNYVRIRLNNPDAEWHIIELGGTGGGGVVTNMDITTEYSIDGSTNWHETLSAADRYFRIRIGTGTPSAAFMLPRLLRHYVEDANVSHVNNRITLTIPEVTAYLVGMEVEFEVVGAVTPANVEVQINSLPFQRLLKFDGSEFRISELRQGVKIVAVYNGTDFVSDFTEKPSFHYVENGVAVTADGNDYTIVDTDIIGFGFAPRSMIGFESRRANTGDMTLVINSSNQFPIRLSDGSDVPSGAIQDDQFLLLTFVSTGWNIINVMPARSLRGQLLATCDIPVGTHDTDVIFPWTVESGISYITADTLPANYVGSNVATDGGALQMPLTRGGRLTQLGWYLEVVNNNTIVYEKLYPFNEYTRDLQLGIETTDGLELGITYWEPFPTILTDASFVVAVKNLPSAANSITVAAGNSYQVRLYLSEN